jgi:hypothetical protein
MPLRNQSSTQVDGMHHEARRKAFYSIFTAQSPLTMEPNAPSAAESHAPGRYRGVGASLILGTVILLGLSALFQILPLNEKLRPVHEPPQWVKFTGRFHPLVLHLPVGLLGFIALLEVGTFAAFRRTLTPAVTAALWIAAPAAAGAVATGWMLALEGGFAEHLLRPHFQLALAITAGSWACLALDQIGRAIPNRHWRIAYRMALLATIGALGIGAHCGGSMTHGETWLTEYLPQGLKTFFVLPTPGGVSSPVSSTPATLPQPKDTTEAIALARQSQRDGRAKDAMALLKQLPEGERRLPEVRQLIERLDKE